MIVFREKKKYTMLLIGVSIECCDVFLGGAEKVLSDNIGLDIMKGIAEQFKHFFILCYYCMQKCCLVHAYM
jgi:hypothetical protein